MIQKGYNVVILRKQKKPSFQIAFLIFKVDSDYASKGITDT